ASRGRRQRTAYRARGGGIGRLRGRQSSGSWEIRVASANCSRSDGCVCDAGHSIESCAGSPYGTQALWPWQAVSRRTNDAASSATSMVSAGELCFQVLSAAFTQAPRTASTPTTEAPVMPVEVSPAYPVMTFVFTGSQAPEELPCMRYAGLHSFVVLLKMQPP